jgi:hypothetical protein
MKITEAHSHLNGLEFLLVHKLKLWEEVQKIISLVSAEDCKIKMMGKSFYKPNKINAKFNDLLLKAGWFNIHKTLTLDALEQKKEIQETGEIPIFRYNQADFIKERVAIEVQFGKYSFVAYDLFVKHLAFYVGDKIDVGIEILPMKSLQSQMSSGVAYYEKELYNVIRQGRGVPAVPLVILGIVP